MPTRVRRNDQPARIANVTLDATMSSEVSIRVDRVAGRWRDQGKITQRAYDQLVNAASTEEEQH